MCSNKYFGIISSRCAFNIAAFLLVLPGLLGAGCSVTLIGKIPVKINGGNQQSETVGRALQPFKMLITQGDGSPTSGVTVDWTLLAGNGSLKVASNVTDKDGSASNELTLGTLAGVNQVAAVVRDSIPPSSVTFTAIGTPGPPVSISVQDGNNQTGVIAGALSSVLQAIVKDMYGNPVPGASVNWSGSGVTFGDGPTSTSDNNGIAVNRLVLGTLTGPYTVTANITATGGAVQSTTFTTTAVLAPASQYLFTGAPSSVVAGSSFSLVVTAKDSNGNTVNDYTGTVHLTSSDPLAILPSNITFLSSDLGVRTISGFALLTAGSKMIIGTDTVTSAITGTSAAIPVNAGVVSLAQSAITSPSTVASGSGITVTLNAKDAYGNLSPTGITAVTFTQSGVGAGTFGSLTNAGSGVYTTSFTGTTAGTVSLSGTINGISLSSAAVNVTVNASGASRLAFQTQPSSSGTAGTALATQPVIAVKDAQGNTVSSASNSITLSAFSDGTCSTPVTGGLSVTTNPLAASSGVATFTGAKVLKTNVLRIQASSSGLSSICSATNMTITSETVVASASTVGSSSSSVTANGTSSVTLTVNLNDAHGNGVSGKAITLGASPSTGVSISPASAVSNSSGQAVFVVTSTSAGAVTFTATDSTDGVTISPSVANITFTAGSATNLSLSSGNNQTGTAGSALGSSLQATVRDASSNAVSGATVTWSVTAGDGSLTTLTTTTDASGTTSNTLTLDTIAGTNTVTATLQGASSVTFTATGLAGSATRLAVSSGDIQSGTSGSPLPGSLQVTVTDSNTNVVSGATVNWAVTSGGGSISSSSTSNTLGIASNILTLGTIAGTNTVTATLQGTSVTFTATGVGGSTVSLAVSGLSSNIIAGTPSSVTITAKDSHGNVSAGYTGTVTFSSSDSQAVLPTNYTFTSSDAGAHAFTSVTLKTAGTDTFVVQDTVTSSITGSASSSVSAAGFALAQSLVSSPSSVLAGSSISVTLTAKDAYGNASPTGITSVTFGTQGMGSGSVSFASNGVGSSGGAGVYTSVATGLQAGNTTLQATINGGLVSSTASITIIPTVSTLAVSGAPTSVTAGAPFSLTLTAKDSQGNIAPSYTGTITFASSDTQATLPSAFTFTGGDAGTHSFISSFTLGGAGSQVLSIGDNNNSLIATAITLTVYSGIASSTTSSIGPSSISITATTSLTTLASSWAPAYSNIKGYWTLDGALGSIASGATISPAMGGNDGTTTGTGLSFAPGVVNQAINFNGTDYINFTPFSDLDNQPGFTVSLWVYPTTSTTFSNYTGLFSLGSGATRTLWVYGNSGARTWTVASSALSSNNVSSTTLTANTWNHLAATWDGSISRLYFNGVADPSGIIGGTSTLVANNATGYIGRMEGYPAFPGRIDEVAVWNTALTASQIKTLYTGPTQAQATSITVTLQDVYGNAIAGQSVTLSGAPATGLTISGPSTTDSSGKAVFSIANTLATTVTFTATYGTQTITLTPTVTMLPGIPAQLAFSTQPVGGAAGTLTAQPVVIVQDAHGNTVTNATNTITLAIATNPGAGTLSGTKTVTAVGGVATFSGLSVDKIGGGYTLRASTSSLITVSSGFTITPAIPSQLAFTTQPGTGIEGHPLITQPVVTIRDAYGNTVTNATNTISLAILANPGSGTLSGTQAVAAVGGIATFSGLSINKGGTGYTLRTSNGTSLTNVTSSSFTIISLIGTAHVVNTGSNSITSLAIGSTGALTSLGSVATGTGPKALSIDPTGRFAYVVNGTGNSVSMFSIDSSTGVLSSITTAIGVGSIPNSIAIHPNGKYAYVTNTGSSNVSMFSINNLTGALTSIGSRTTLNSGLSGIAVEPSGKFAYIANKGSGTISILSIDSSTGTLTSNTTFTISVSNPDSLVIDPTGRFVYVSHTIGTNRVSMFSMNSTTGALTSITTAISTTGEPTGIVMDPRGKFVYVSTSSSTDVYIYSINATTGALTLSSTSTHFRSASNPIVSVDVTGRYAYVGTNLANSVATFNINATTGDFTPVTSSTVAVGSNPTSIATTTRTKLLAFTSQPSSSVTAGVNLAIQPVVTIQDLSGFTVAASQLPITLKAFSDSSCTNEVIGGISATSLTLNASQGVASFAGVKVLNKNVKRLQASNTYMTSACSSTDLSVSAGTVSASGSSVGSSVSTATADGTSAVTFIVTLNDSYGNVVSGKTVTLGASPSTGVSISPASVVTNSSGQAEFVVTSSTAGTVTLTATDTTDSITITPSTTLTFTAAASVLFSPSSGPVGTLLTLTGMDFTTLQSINVGGTSAIPVSSSTTLLTALVAPGTSSGQVSVITTAHGTLISSSTFSVTATGIPKTQQAGPLLGTGASGVSGQGSSVALSADGNTALVGGRADNGNKGGVWVFTRNGSNWTQQGLKLSGTGASVNANQGSSVALSADGKTALIGGFYDNSGQGATWVFTRSGATWAEQGLKLLGIGGSSGANQGNAVALSADGNTAIIGGSNDNSGVGATWVFIRNGSNWTQQGSKLVGSGWTGQSMQGFSVALSSDGNTALIGGYSDNSGTGATWVFTRSGSDWAQQGPKLVGSLGSSHAAQGSSVALSADGNTALIGGYTDNSVHGAAWVFTRSGSNWTQQAPKLVGSGAVGANQGSAVALSADGNTALIGGYYDEFGLGATWVFTRSGSTWAQQGLKLVGSGGSSDAEQGTSVALSADGTTALIGAPANNGYTGSSWVFTSP